jgi:hypothetical protein
MTVQVTKLPLLRMQSKIRHSLLEKHTTTKTWYILWIFLALILIFLRISMAMFTFYYKNYALVKWDAPRLHGLKCYGLAQDSRHNLLLGHNSWTDRLTVSHNVPLSCCSELAAVESRNSIPQCCWASQTCLTFLWLGFMLCLLYDPKIRYVLR